MATARLRRRSDERDWSKNLEAALREALGAAYLFTVPWRTGDGINIRYSVTTGTIKRLLIDEIGGAE